MRRFPPWKLRSRFSVISLGEEAWLENRTPKRPELKVFTNISHSVQSRLGCCFDDDYIDQTLLRFQLEPELFLQSCEQAGIGGIGRDTFSAIFGPVQREVI